MSRYIVCGIVVDADCELPELPAVDSPAQVTIRSGVVPRTLCRPRVVNGHVQASQGELLFTAPQVARYLIQNGLSIAVDSESGVIDRESRSFLLGTPLAALLYQRGITSFHGSAVVTRHGAVLFCGPSRAGKSTLSAEFISRGYKWLADDTAAVTISRFNDQVVAFIQPEFPSVKLWTDAIHRLRPAADRITQVRAGREKFWISVRDSYAREPAPVAKIVLIDRQPTTEIALERLSGQSALLALRRQMFGRTLAMADLNLAKRHFENLSIVVEQCQIYRLACPASYGELSELTSVIESRLALT